MAPEPFKVVEGSSKAVAECLPALPAANDKDGLAAPKSVAAVIGKVLGRRSAVRTLPGKGFGLDHDNPNLPLTAQSFQRSATEYPNLTNDENFTLQSRQRRDAQFHATPLDVSAPSPDPGRP